MTVQRYLLAAACTLMASSVIAQEDTLNIHGYAHWRYGHTDENEYAGGTPEGSYETGNAALLFRAAPAEKLVTAIQLEMEAEDGVVEPDLDFAFAEWRFADRLSLRAGAARHPFGLYSETLEAGILRPLPFLPQSIYGGTGTVAERYIGLGLTGRRGSGPWTLEYDVYFGEVQAEVDALDVEREGEEEDEDDEGDEGDEEGEEEAIEGGSISDTLGGRLVVRTPVEGLAFGISAYTGKEVEHEDSRQSAVGLQAEYAAGPWTLRSEFVHTAYSEEDVESTQALYLEAARRLGPRWQLAARYDWGKLDDPRHGNADHEDLAVGVGYWFSPGFVMKGAYHHVGSERFILPEDETGSPSTNLFVVSVDFSF